MPFPSILRKVFDLKKHLPLFILRRHCPFFLHDTEISRLRLFGRDFISSIPLPIPLRRRRLTGRRDRFNFELDHLFFWAAKEYGRTAYAHGIR